MVREALVFGLPVDAVPEPGESYPLTSGLTLLRSPARDLLVGFADRFPAVLTGGTEAVPVATLSLTNPAPAAG